LASIGSLVVVIVVACEASAFAQAKPSPQTPPAPSAAPPPAVVRPADVAVPGNYVIGTDDLLGIVYWRDKEMSTDARVRPDGRISLPLINEVQAAGLTPEALQKKITEESAKHMEDASITIVVREIHSLKVFITGEVNKPGPYPITSVTTVMQLHLACRRPEGIRQQQEHHDHARRGISRRASFNYKEVASGKNLKQNIDLKPGDTVVVP
jgi:polysaccharide export outer membrane protein